jgi:transcriptional regulator with XRE-family HTH domain
VITYDGPTLRAVREQMNVPLRRIARHAGMSHGHLSKVERGEYGRPVTPAIITAYERVTGVTLAAAAAAIEDANRPSALAGGDRRMWQPGELSGMRRQGYTAAIGSLSVGGHLGEPFIRLIESTGRPLTPAPPDNVDVTQLAQLVQWVISLDLRFGGGLVSQLAKTLLKWAVPMLDTTNLNDPVSCDLHRAVGGLAHRAAWACFDTGGHEAARSLFRLALYAASRAKDRNLRAFVIADVAAQYNALGYHDDCLEILRLAGGDEQVAPAVRAALHGVKARAHAEVGKISDCYDSLQLLEAAHADASPQEPGWLGTVAQSAYMHANVGHALAIVASKSESEAELNAASRALAEAVDTFDVERHARAHALCVSRLAILYLKAGELDEGARWARLAVSCMATVRSVRLSRGVTSIRALAAAQPDEVLMRELVEEIDAADRPNDSASQESRLRDKVWARSEGNLGAVAPG